MFQNLNEPMFKKDKYLMTNREPNNWEELQDYVAHYFNFSGYNAEVTKTISTARGNVEIDVFVSIEHELSEFILCECKFWNTNIPKEKVHAFRTIISDSGASGGIIISKKGFQSGAYSAAKHTNIKLFTWTEFLDYLYDKWFIFRRKRLLRKMQPLSVYTDPLDVPIDELNKSQLDEYNGTLDKYISLYIGCAPFFIHSSNNPIKNYNKYQSDNITTLEEYFENMEIKVEEAINYYENLFSPVVIPQSKFNI